MNIKKFVPWNWFKNEEEIEKTVPVQTHKDDLSPHLTQPLFELYRNFNSLFDNFFNAPRLSSRINNVSPMMTRNILKPTLDISESDDQYLISVEVPGVDEEDLVLEVVNDCLIIKGEKKNMSKADTTNYFRVECSYGSFKRTLSLPNDADTENITAFFKNGILTVNIARNKIDETKIKKIEINNL